MHGHLIYNQPKQLSLLDPHWCLVSGKVGVAVAHSGRIESRGRAVAFSIGYCLL